MAAGLAQTPHACCFSGAKHVMHMLGRGLGPGPAPPHTQSRAPHLNVDAACRDVGADEEAHVTILECLRTTPEKDVQGVQAHSSEEVRLSWLCWWVPAPLAAGAKAMHAR